MSLPGKTPVKPRLVAREDWSGVEDIRIYFIGDSYVNGTGDPTYLGWPGRVCKASRTSEIAITCYNLGIRADTSTDVLRRWEQEVAARSLIPHDGRVVFGFGANDCWIESGTTRVKRTDTVKNTEQILMRAHALFPTLMVGPPPGINSAQNVQRAEMSTLLATIAQKVGVPYLEIINDLEADGTWQREASRGDQIHPDLGGYCAPVSYTHLTLPTSDLV